MIKNIIIIQKYIRRYVIQKQILIPSSYYQTKEWRKNKDWYKNGKSNECEKYQIDLIGKIMRRKIKDFLLMKTDDRINIESNEIINKKNPMINNDGYEWTENFDGKIIKNNNIYYFNLKFVCDNGGAQTRN
jgi:non-homologous end joining protein Ku